MSDLTGFLLARIAEDEARAREADARIFPSTWGETLAVVRTPAHVNHIGHMNPARVLVECEAKRQIITYCDPHGYADDGGGGMSEHADNLLRMLSLPYADHPNYRDEWKP